MNQEKVTTYTSFDPANMGQPQLHGLMLGLIAPRPIAFVSTVDANGQVNLSPFSFFNAFGSAPPVIVFSPARRGRDNTIKHTLENVQATGECVVNVVSFEMVEQMSLASCEYDRGVNEFVKAGFTEIASTKVKAPRVAESPASFECKMLQVIETGQTGGAGNLVVCEIVAMHISNRFLDEDGKLKHLELDLVGRMGADWYCRANHEAMFEVPKPNIKKGVGFDALPKHVRLSEILTGNDLGRLANLDTPPTVEEKEELQFKLYYQRIWTLAMTHEERHQLGKRLIAENKLREAWAVLC